MAFIQTEGPVRLCEIERADLAQIADWRNDPRVRLRTREHAPLTELDQERWYEHVVCAPTRQRTTFMFGIEVARETTSPQGHAFVGVCGLCDWQPRDRTAEISFYIGDTENEGKGYTKAALTMLIKWGFEELGLDRIWAEVYETNAACLKLLGKLGFEIEGTLRKHVFREGRRIDSIMMGRLAPGVIVIP